MANRKRHVVEGTWSGYSGNSGLVCHRVVTKYPESLNKITAVGFTDGTQMFISVRLCVPRERVDEIHGYDWLLGKICAQKLTGFVHVNQVQDR